MLVTYCSVDAQIYQTIPGYGFKWQRVMPDSVLHLPSSTDTTLRTSYTTAPQIRKVGDSLWFYNGSRWLNVSRGGLDSTTLLNKTVRTFGAQSVAGVKTFTDSVLFRRPFVANADMAVFGTNSANNIKISWGATSDHTQVKIGDSFALSRNGTGDPSITATSKGLLVYSDHQTFYGPESGGIRTPPDMRLVGNYGLGIAKFGAYNGAASALYFGNSSGDFIYNQITYGRNNQWMINDTSTVPTYSASAIMSLQSTKKGFAPPRMTTAQRDAIVSPITGLEIYNTTTGKKDYYNGSAWIPLIGSNDTTGLLNNVVRTFGDQTIGGNKTFTNDININGITVGRAGGNLIGTTAFGNGALVNNTTGYENTAFGYQALNVVDTGFRNAAFGWKALSKNLARYNSAFGFSALENNTTGNSNTGIGVNALRDNTTGGLNTGVGHDALEYNITGSNNTAIGYRTLVLATTANQNTAVGSRSMYYTTSGSNNTAIGYGTLDSNLTGFGNIAMGYEALKQQKSDNYNIAIGYASLFRNNGGNTNISIGFNGMSNNITGDNNVVLGASTLSSSTAGSNNTALGYLTLYNALGSRNIAIGNYAGFYATGSDEFFLNHRNRTNYAGDTSLSLLYGKLDEFTALQRLRVNGNLIVSGGATFGGRAGYNRSNYSSILTDSSFTHKKYVDSTVALKLNGSGTINTIPLWTGSTITLGNSSMTSVSGRIQVGGAADDGTSQMRVNGFFRGGIITADAGYRLNGAAGGWDRKYSFFGSSGTDRGGFGAAGGTDVLTYYYIGQNSTQNAVRFAKGDSAATFYGTITATQPIIAQSGISATKLIGISSAPSVTLGANITGSVTVSGSDMDGTVTITVTGASSLASLNELFTLTYNSAYSSTPRVVWSAESVNAAALIQAAGGLYLKNNGTSSFQIATVNSYTTPASATYAFTYHVIQ